MKAINLQDKFARFTEHWSPKIVAQINDYQIKVVKIRGEFVWHKHEDTDELFFVHKGTMVLRTAEGDLHLSAGELAVVPRGLEHKPEAEEECEILLFEPVGTLNTGDAGGDRTVAELPWI